MKYLKYLAYVLRHKWFVGVQCFKMGLYWRGLTHDLSKLRPSELVPYANYFYGRETPPRDGTGYYKPTDTAFDFAWLLHQKVNDHHWQWWILPEDGGGVKVLAMSFEARLEMLCDWRGASRAQGFNGSTDLVAWYEKNKDKMQLHPLTRRKVEDYMYLLGTGEI